MVEDKEEEEPESPCCTTIMTTMTKMMELGHQCKEGGDDDNMNSDDEGDRGEGGW